MNSNSHSKNPKDYLNYAVLFFTMSFATFIIVGLISLLQENNTEMDFGYFIIPLIFAVLSALYFLGYFYFKKKDLLLYENGMKLSPNFKIGRSGDWREK